MERDDKAADKAGRAAAQELVLARRATAKGACGRKMASLAAKVAARLRALTDEVARRPARVADPRRASARSLAQQRHGVRRMRSVTLQTLMTLTLTR